jgi:predicted MFS family arabinose efflux permease
MIKPKPSIVTVILKIIRHTYEEVREYVYQLNYWMFNIGTAIGMALGALLYLGQ